MSEYQYYEFRSIDHPLSDEAQAEIGRLSSRVELTPTSAAFTYHYGDFRGDPLSVLAKHFDILLYMANWGTRQIAFRLPRAIVDAEMLAPYAVEDMISINVVDKHFLLNIEIYDEGGDHDWGWIEGEGWMDSIAPLRDDLLRGDYRLLYLAWLAASQIDPDLESEPPVPANLGKLSRPLKVFADFYGIDQDLLTVAAKASSIEQAPTRAETATLVATLSEQERTDYLVRVANGDPLVSMELIRRLAVLERETPKGSKRGARPKAGPSRSAAQLLASAEEESVLRKQREAEKARKARVRELEQLGEREQEAWQKVASLLAESRAKAHEEAVKLLVDLRDLAAHRGTPEEFSKRIEQIGEDNRHRHSLTRRLREAGLIAK